METIKKDLFPQFSKPETKVEISRYRDGVGWTVTATTLKEALQMWDVLQDRFGGSGGYVKER